MEGNNVRLYRFILNGSGASRMLRLQECINFMLSDAQNVVHNYFKSRLQMFDVTPVQYALLKCLWIENMQTPTQLSQMLGLDTSSITGTLDRLERKNLLTRVYSKEDRRSVSVCLTEGGSALQAPIEEVIVDANRQVLTGVSEEEYEIFKKVLAEVVENTRNLSN